MVRAFLACTAIVLGVAGLVAQVKPADTAVVLSAPAAAPGPAAAQAKHYSISSYRRIATSAYGSPDVDHEAERIESLEVAADGLRVTLRLARLRPGFIYEFRLSHLGPPNAFFFPAEAHYTLRQVP